MDSQTRLLYWLFNASRGGPTRLKIIRLLKLTPKNLHKLSISLGMDYKTVQGHVEILLKNGIIDKMGNGYGSIYFVNQIWEDNNYFKQLLIGDNDEKKV